MLHRKESNSSLNHSLRCIKPRFLLSSYSTTLHQLLTKSNWYPFFDYITALYPILLTILVYALIELHARNCRVVAIASMPLRQLYHYFDGRWDPKQSILSTFATFLLLSYSKILFASCNFLIAVQSYNSTGDQVPNSTILLYDPNIHYFTSEHIIPYIITALSALIFILLPPLFLLLYPTCLFKALLTCCGFRRWDILHMIMDTFQGWYKDGTEGTYDYRPLSALYMLLRVALVGEFLIVIALSPHSNSTSKWFITGFLHVYLGSFFSYHQTIQKAMDKQCRWFNIDNHRSLLLYGPI